jgi:single-strand DNA-binding protein
MSVGETYLQIHGRVGTDVEFKESTSGIPMASFRLATTPRRFNKADQRWEDKPTAWFTVECWRQLAVNVNESLQKGQPVFVSGRLKTREWVDEHNERQTRSNTIDAQSVGHDLSWGTTLFTRNERQPRQQADSAHDEMDELSATVEAAEPNPFHADEGVGGDFGTGGIKAA